MWKGQGHYDKMNELPTEIKDAPTVPVFASGLNKFYAFNWYFS